MRTKYTWFTLLAALLLVAPVGCKKTTADEGDEAAESSAEEGSEAAESDENSEAAEVAGDDEGEAGTEGTEAAAGEAPVQGDDDNPFNIASSVELLEQGSEPRREIRYKLDQIQPVIARFTMATESRVDAGEGRVQEVTLPEMTLDISMKNPTMQDDGNLRIEFELISLSYEASGDDPQAQMMARMMEQQLGEFEYSGFYIISPRGKVIDGEVDMGSQNPQLAQMADNIEQSLQQLTTAFPEEAVGVGARWKVIQEYGDTLPFDLEQEVIFEILELDGDVVKIKTTIDQNADGQTIEDDQMPEGSQVEIEEFHTEGTGEMTFSLASLAPEGEMSLEMTMAVKGTIPGQGEQSMRTNMRMDMTMAEAPADAARQAEEGSEAAE